MDFAVYGRSGVQTLGVDVPVKCSISTHKWRKKKHVMRKGEYSVIFNKPEAFAVKKQIKFTILLFGRVAMKR